MEHLAPPWKLWQAFGREGPHRVAAIAVCSTWNTFISACTVNVPRGTFFLLCRSLKAPARASTLSPRPLAYSTSSLLAKVTFGGRGVDSLRPIPKSVRPGHAHSDALPRSLWHRPAVSSLAPPCALAENTFSG